MYQKGSKIRFDWFKIFEFIWSHLKLLEVIWSHLWLLPNEVIWSHLKSFEVIQYHYSRSWILDEKWVKNELEMFKKDCKMIKNEWIWLKTIENMSILVKLLEMTSFEQVSNGDESDKHL